MIFVLKKKTLIKVVLISILIVTLSILVYDDGVVPTAAATKKLPIYYVESGTQKAALTFDAAWGADKTSQIMDILEKEGYRGTFFLVGFWIDKYPEKVQEIHDRGHLVGNHSTNHLHMNKLSKDDIAKEINLTSQKIKNAIGYSPRFFRAPFGEYSNRMLEYADESGVQVIQWDVDTLDWKGLSGGEIASRVIAKAKDGSIILCHNNSDHILEALPLMIAALKNKGITPVRLDELVLESDYYIDSNGKQIKK
ncbi:MAG: polysaccharide deacetylase family protein [Clostridia bacterium]